MLQRAKLDSLKDVNELGMTINSKSDKVDLPGIIVNNSETDDEGSGEELEKESEDGNEVTSETESLAETVAEVENLLDLEDLNFKDYATNKKTATHPTFVTSFQETGQISVIHLSPYEISQDLILIAFPTKILLGQLIFQDTIEFKQLAEFNNEVASTALALSSETAINTLPQSVIFCSAGVDYKLRIYKSDLGKESYYKVLSGHSSFINEISYDPENNYIASVSDDNTVRIWDVHDYSCVAILLLSSPGMSTCWHREDSSKLMVAEKIGLIRFYNVNTQKQILSLEYGKSLSAAHWAPSDSQMVSSLHLGELVIWDLSHPSRPTNSKIIHAMNGGCLRINSSGELIASVNPLEGCLKVSLFNSQQQRLLVPVKLPTNVTWHFRLPLLCIADDNKLYFWSVSKSGWGPLEKATELAAVTTGKSPRFIKTLRAEAKAAENALLKSPSKEQKSGELIIVAVRRNPLTQNVAQQEVESIIKLWLTNGGIEMVEDCIGRTRIMLPN
ncbi:hypothetical protein RN001_002696 [Aquatica leii]|uniref:Uncharacterized protein n=1 Tax=Aquatica leii TaxID=1421715 RepID=A0AAN7SSW1_9COLE|nr:hypothetical protein RN001_002696 [Aquatica leii]